MSKKTKITMTLPGYVPVRDELIVHLICGATKAGTYTDRKKEQNRKACRQRVQKDDE